MSWEIRYLPEVLEDFRALDGSQRILVRKAIEKVRKIFLPETEGGYGKWLGNKGASKLSGFLKIKLRGAGLRIVYQLVRNANRMVLVVIGVREETRFMRSRIIESPNMIYRESSEVHHASYPSYPRLGRTIFQGRSFRFQRLRSGWS